MALEKHLSRKDMAGLLEFIHSALDISTEEEFRERFLKLRDLIRFEMGCTTFVNIDQFIRDGAAAYEVVNINYPEEYLSQYLAERHDLIDDVTLEFFKTFQLVNWNDLIRNQLNGEKNVVIHEAEAVGLVDGFAYGVHDWNRSYGTVIYWGGPSVENDERTRTIIRYVTPHLSEALKRLVSHDLITREKMKNEVHLTPKEVEVLKWLKEGKSSWEISMILGVSVNTVNYHVKNILKRLNAMNRRHAVAIAMENRIIQF